MSQTRQPEPSPAQLFERFFGPALFQPWTRELLEHAPPRSDDRVLDLACATGIVARQVAPRLGNDGAVVGLDLDPAMLEVAADRGRAEGVDVRWVRGDATDLEQEDGAFDLVLCQQGLQFFDDPLAALRECRRVLVDGGRLAATVWQPLERHPLYSAILEAEAEHLDADLDDVARPFAFGGGDRLRSLLDAAGLEGVDVVHRTLEVEFPDPDAFVELTVMAGAAVVPELAPDDPAERDALVDAVTRACGDVLEAHRHGDRLRFPTPNLVATARA